MIWPEAKAVVSLRHLALFWWLSSFTCNVMTDLDWKHLLEENKFQKLHHENFPYNHLCYLQRRNNTAGTLYEMFPGLLDIFFSIQVLLNTCDVICQNPFGHVSDLERNRYYNLSLLFTTHWIVQIFSFYTTKQASYINLELGLPRKTYVAFQLLLENRK